MDAARFFVGLDLGQARDFTALAVLERVEADGGYDPVTWERRKVVSMHVRHMERIPLGTTYPAVVERVSEVMRTLPGGSRGELMVDATGVGRPVVDLLREEDLECRVRPVMVTAGAAESESDGYAKVPKRELMTGLQVLMQTEQLKVAKGLPFGPTLLKELTEMRVKVTVEGNEQFGAWREGTHDDLVFAVALAAWGAKRSVPGDMAGRRRLF